MQFPGYGYLWKIFSLFGIDVNQSSRTTKHSSFVQILFKFPYLFLFMTSSVYNFLIILKSINASLLEIRALLPNLITFILSNILWFLMNQRRLVIRLCLMRATEFSAKHRFKIFAGRFTFNVVLVVYFTLNIAYIMIAVYIMNLFVYPDNNVWTLGYYMKYDFLGNTTRIFLVMSFVLLISAFPGFVTILACAMFMHLNSLLKNCKENLVKLNEVSSDCLMHFVKEYSKLLGLVHEFSSILSIPIFLLMVMHLLCMFTGTAIFLMNQEILKVNFIGENAFLLISGTSYLMLLVITASNIHVQTQAISGLLKDVYEREISSSKLSSRDLKVLQTIANKDAVLISACGMIQFTRNYIISVLGGFITYALLFISINSNSSYERVCTCTDP